MGMTLPSLSPCRTKYTILPSMTVSIPVRLPTFARNMGRSENWLRGEYGGFYRPTPCRRALSSPKHRRCPEINRIFFQSLDATLIHT